MKRVYICAKFSKARWNREKYENLARIYCRMAWDKGFCPIAPRLYLTQFLDDENKAEREIMTKTSVAEIKNCAELWVFGETIKNRQRVEIEEAERLKIPVKYFNQYGEAIEKPAI